MRRESLKMKMVAMDHHFKRMEKTVREQSPGEQAFGGLSSGLFFAMRAEAELSPLPSSPAVSAFHQDPTGDKSKDLASIHKL